MLYKPLVALFMAFAAAGGVAASTTPVRRGGGHGSYPPPSGTKIPAGNCDSNTQLYCCNELTNINNPEVGIIAKLLELDPTNVVGLKCNSLNIIGTSNTCTANSVCCSNTYQSGLINTGCTQVIL